MGNCRKCGAGVGFYIEDGICNPCWTTDAVAKADRDAAKPNAIPLASTLARKLNNVVDENMTIDAAESVANGKGSSSALLRLARREVRKVRVGSKGVGRRRNAQMVYVLLSIRIARA